MNLQDRAYAVGIFLVLGICCIGAYVGVSGIMGSNPGGLTLGLNSATATAETAATVTLAPNATLAPISTLAPAPTGQPTSPVATVKGSKPTATSPTRGTPTSGILSDLPTAAPTTTGSPPTATPASAAGCGTRYCPVLNGAPTTDAPTGNPCPRTYLWGFVKGPNGKGIPGMQVNFVDPEGNADRAFTKGPPDPAGRWEVVAGSGNWAIQVVDSSGKAVSPLIRIQAGKVDASGKTCPTRLDFVEQQG